MNDMTISFESAEGQTFRESFCAEYRGDNTTMCSIVSLASRWDGEDAPSIRFLLLWEDGSEIYASNSYTPAKNGETKRWRIPPFLKRGVYCRAEISVPVGSTLEILSLNASYESFAAKGTDAELDAHLGFFGAAPENTEIAFRLAGLCGFHNCITVPKRTRDGVYVCIHDDTIARTARDSAGNVPKPDLAVSDLTYEELLNWDFGLRKHSIYAGEKIPLLEDYFRICRAYGMNPIFSVHPCFPPEQWEEIAEIADRNCMLHKLRLKSEQIEPLQTIFNVLGNEAGGYILWHEAYSDELPAKLATLGLDLTRTRGTVEALHRPEAPWRAEYVRTVESYGFHASGLACWGHHADTYYRELMDMGVREFTEDYHCSGALEW